MRPTMRQAALAALRSRRTGAPEPDLGLLLTEVASLLRAGATPQRAWTRSLKRAGLTGGTEPADDGVPPVLHALADLRHDSWLPRWGNGHLRWRARAPLGGGRRRLLPPVDRLGGALGRHPPDRGRRSGRVRSR